MKTKDTKKCSKKNKMIMKWEDLEPGDKVKYNPEYIKKVYNSTMLYNYEIEEITEKENTIFTINHVDIYEECEDYDKHIILEFKNSGAEYWEILCDGTPSDSLYSFGKIPVFTLVSLAKEKNENKRYQQMCYKN